MSIAKVVAVVLCYSGVILAEKYNYNDLVTVWANKVGPLFNPLETYEYFSLGICKPISENLNRKFPSLGEALLGDELVEHANLALRFKKDTPKTTVCHESLSQDSSNRLIEAIKQQYWYQFYVEDLPVYGVLGTADKDGVRIYTHQNFSIGYTDLPGHVVIADVSPGGDVVLVADAINSLEFTYSVTWHKAGITYEQRFRRYLDNKFFEKEIQWFGLANSFCIVIVLTIMVLLVLVNALKRDYVRYQAKEPEEGHVQDETGWKLVSGEVFRVPRHPAVLCALVGTGLQLTMIIICTLLESYYGMLYASRGAILTFSIVMWAVTSFIAGYASSHTFCQFVQVDPAISRSWVHTMLLTSMLFPATVGGLIFLMNFVAWGYHSARAIPFGTMIVMVCLWVFGAFPLTFLGTLIARVRVTDLRLPKPSIIQRSIPELPFRHSRSVLVPVGGLIVFFSVFVELQFVFGSFWDYKLHCMYGFVLLAFLTLLWTTACISVMVTYRMLCREDGRWMWSTFGIGGFAGLYLLCFEVYYFFNKTKMSGLLNVTLYFGYSVLLAIGFAITIGAIAFVSARMFVIRIYRYIKAE